MAKRPIAEPVHIPAAFFTVDDVAARLDVSRRTITRAIDAGQFPGAVQIGQRWRIPADDLAAWIKERQPYRQA